MKQCLIEDCEQTFYAKGLCRNHYNQSPIYKLRQKQYNQRPEVQLRRKHYQRTPERKLYQKQHSRTFKGRFNQLNSAAKRRQIPQTISFEEYRDLVTNACCYYCTSNLPEASYGLDRLDNTKGYELSNVVPCCSECNFLRGDILTVEETKVAALAIKAFRTGVK